MSMRGRQSTQSRPRIERPSVAPLFGHILRGGQFYSQFVLLPPFSDRREEERLKITSLGRIGVRGIGLARAGRERVKEGEIQSY